MRIEILATGTGLSLQDRGRNGWGRFGVPPSGALDRHAMANANRLLGNRPTAPVLEVRLQGTRLRVLEPGWLAVSGADFCPQLPAWTARRFEAGALLEFSAKGPGLLSYLAVPGGFSADRWFGSVSIDSRNGLGCALFKGQQLASVRKAPLIEVTGIARRLTRADQRRDYAAQPIFELLKGPQFESFSAKARQQLVSGQWTVTANSDRTGYRLDGAPLEPPGQIASEPVLPGSFQVPGNGLPIITMNDGPTVGGYPKIAVLQDSDRDRLAQCAPGAQVSFRWV